MLCFNGSRTSGHLYIDHVFLTDVPVCIRICKFMCVWETNLSQWTLMPIEKDTGVFGEEFMSSSESVWKQQFFATLLTDPLHLTHLSKPIIPFFSIPASPHRSIPDRNIKQNRALLLRFQSPSHSPSCHSKKKKKITYQVVLDRLAKVSLPEGPWEREAGQIPVGLWNISRALSPRVKSMVLLIRPSSPDRPTARGLEGEQSTRELFYVRLCSRTKRGLKHFLLSRSGSVRRQASGKEVAVPETVSGMKWHSRDDLVRSGPLAVWTDG